MRHLTIGFVLAILTFGVTVQAQAPGNAHAALTYYASIGRFQMADPAGSWQFTFTLRLPGKYPRLQVRPTPDQSGALTARIGRRRVTLALVDGDSAPIELRVTTDPAERLDAVVIDIDSSPSLIAAAVPLAGTYALHDPTLLQTVDGEPANLRANALFDIRTDTLLQAGPDVSAPILRAGHAAFIVHPARSGALLRITPRYYHDTLHLPFYTPFTSPFAHDRIHTGWMDWYYTYGNMNEPFMLNNLRWLHDNLQKFGVDVFQLDMYWYKNNNYRQLDPAKFTHDLKWYVAQVNSAGFLPGIWVGPWARDESMAKAHPDWFLHDPNGQIVRDWPNDNPHVSPLLDCTNHGASQEMYDLFHYLHDDVGFRYFKLDGQPVYWGHVQQAKLYQPKMRPVDAYRAGYSQIRRAIGDDFMLSCWGIVTEGMGISNGSRTGGDVDLNMGLFTSADTTARWLFLNRICWFSDPDVLEVRAPEPLEKARAWASLLGLSGQMLMLSDDMPALTPDRVDLLKRIIPVAHLRPVDLRPQTRADIMDARIARPWETWDVVGLFNFNSTAQTRTLDLRQLGLATGPGQSYLVYDFWNRSLVGVTNGALTFDVPAEGCRVFSVRRMQSHPQLLFTSRHLTQGAIELRNVRWDARHDILSGVSDLVAGDPYTLTFSLPSAPDRYLYRSAFTDAGRGSTHISSTSTTLSLTVASPVSRTIRWRVSFKRVRNRPLPLRPPQNVTTFYIASKGVELAWKPAQGALTYTVLRDGRAVGTVAADSQEDGPLRFVDRSLLPFGARRYAISAQGWKPGRAARSREALVTLPAVAEIYLSDLTTQSEHQGWGTLGKDRSVDGHPITLGGVQYTHGLGAHSTTGGIGEQVYALDRQFSRFTALVGIDDEVGKRGSVVFQVWVDGVKRYDSGILRGGDPAKSVSVDLKGAQTLRLVETDAGDGFDYDHSDWADARLIPLPIK